MCQQRANAKMCGGNRREASTFLWTGQCFKRFSVQILFQVKYYRLISSFAIKLLAFVGYCFFGQIIQYE